MTALPEGVPANSFAVVPDIQPARRVLVSVFAVGVLAVVGLIMGAIFHQAFVTPFSLDEHGLKIWQTVATLTQYSASGAFDYVVAFALLFAVYVIGYLVVFPRRPAPMSDLRTGTHMRRRGIALWAVVGLGAVVMNAVLLPMYPLDAADVYDYIMRGRMTSVYGMNPMREAPDQVPEDPFYRFVAWRRVPSAYGPAWEVIAAVTTALAGEGITENVIAFKLVAIAGYVLVIVAIGLALRKLAPRRALASVYLFAWNPLVLFMTAGTAHNDSLMVACMVLALAFLVRRWLVAATLAALFGALIKFIPLLLVPFVAVVALRDWRVPGWRRLLRTVVVSVLLGGVMAAAFYAPFWFGIETLRAERRAAMYTGTWWTLLRQELAPHLDRSDAETWLINTPNTNALISTTTLGLFGIFYLIQLVRVYRARNDLFAPVRASALVFLFYLLVVTLWFQAWYVIWVLAMVVLLEEGFLRRLTLFFCYAVTFQPLLYNFFSLRAPAYGDYAPLPWRDLVPIGVVMGSVYLFVALHWFNWGLDRWRRGDR